MKLLVVVDFPVLAGLVGCCGVFKNAVNIQSQHARHAATGHLGSRRRKSCGYGSLFRALTVALIDARLIFESIPAP